MARLKGLEPLTHCLEGSCSIHLSYRRIYAPPNGAPAKPPRSFVGKGEARKQVELSPQAEAGPADFASTLERVMGIEPTRPAWKAGILPLNYTRMVGRIRKCQLG